MTPWRIIIGESGDRVGGAFPFGVTHSSRCEAESAYLPPATCIYHALKHHKRSHAPAIRDAPVKRLRWGHAGTSAVDGQ